MEEAERLADRIVVMREGAVVATGTPATLGGRDRAAGDRHVHAPAGVRPDELPRAALERRGRGVEMALRAAVADLHELTGLGARPRTSSSPSSRSAGRRSRTSTWS